MWVHLKNDMKLEKKEEKSAQRTADLLMPDANVKDRNVDVPYTCQGVVK